MNGSDYRELRLNLSCSVENKRSDREYYRNPKSVSTRNDLGEVNDFKHLIMSNNFEIILLMILT